MVLYAPTTDALPPSRTQPASGRYLATRGRTAGITCTIPGAGR
jgi:hypothetical protein